MKQRLYWSALAAVFLWIFSVQPSYAVLLTQISIGDRYYLHRSFDDNVLVKVIGVDQTSGKVKVRFDGGGIDWIEPYKLMTESENDRDEANSAAGGLFLFGCAFDPSDPSCRPQPWAAGKLHPRVANVLSSEERGTWHPAPGYVWETGRFGNVVWAPGRAHPDYPNVFAARQEGTWTPANGYDWKTPGVFGPVTRRGSN